MVSGVYMNPISLKCEVTVPTVEEQYKLGLLLDNLDTLITLHQREHIKPILEVKRVKRNE